MNAEMYHHYMYAKKYDPSDAPFRKLAKEWKERQKYVAVMQHQFSKVREKYANTKRS